MYIVGYSVTHVKDWRIKEGNVLFHDPTQPIFFTVNEWMNV